MSRPLALLCALCLTFSMVSRAGAEPVIELQPNSRTAIVVSGLDANNLKALADAKKDRDGWVALLGVYVGEKDVRQRFAMLGDYKVQGKELRFEAQFPLQLGVKYQVVLDPSRLPFPPEKADRITRVVLIPKPKRDKPTEITNVFPSGNQIPENQLKFYIHFSRPMSQGVAYEHIQLVNEQGKPIERGFLELPEELWTTDFQRFTLFIDPGRIKRGLRPREELGPVFEEGKKYTLIIDRNWPDAEGNPLGKTFRKAITVAGPDDHQPDPKKWKVEAPKADTTQPLLVKFPEPLDEAMLNRVVWVIDDRGETVQGTIAVKEQETHWLFTPARPWRAGSYNLVAETILEDLAGNSIARPFEVDIFRKIETNVEPETVKVPFAVKGGIQ